MEETINKVELEITAMRTDYDMKFDGINYLLGHCGSI